MKAETILEGYPSGTEFLIRETTVVEPNPGARHLSSYELNEFRRNPRLFRRRELGYVGDGNGAGDLLDHAAHVLILDGQEALEREFASQGAKAKSPDRLTIAQAALIENMNDSVYAHAHAAALLATGVAGGVVRVEYEGLPCHAQLDWLCPERGLVELKSCENLDWFPMDARVHDTVHHLAFQRSLVEAASGRRHRVHVIAVERREPFRCGVWRLGEELLTRAEKENKKAINRLRECRRTGLWPTGYEDIRDCDWI